METQECLDNLEKALVAEGVSEEERKHRVQDLKEVIETTETKISKMKEKAAEWAKPRFKIQTMIESLLLAFVLGMLAGAALQESMSAAQ
jgi:hypothetical protein